jgi:tetratricopeptide (TPR) repeat protein
MCVLLLTSLAAAHNVKPAKEQDKEELIKTSEARTLYDKGMAEIKKGELDAAAKNLREAAGKEPDNPFLRRQYLSLRVAIRLRKAIALEKNPERWWKSAVALYRFYSKHELDEQLLELTTEMHKRRNTPQTALLMASAQLRLNKNADAATTLKGVPTEQQTLHGRIVLGIALAREDANAAEAKAIVSDTKPESLKTPIDLFYFARLQTLTGQSDSAIDNLVKAFGLTRPSALNEFKELVRKSPDFKTIRESDAFAMAMKTESKTPESACSGGSTCGSCAQRSTCSSSQSPSEGTGSADGATGE